VACVLARTSGGQLIWAGPLVYMMTAMLFGASDTFASETGTDAYYWWATILSEHTTDSQLLTAGAMAAVALATRATTPP